MTPFFAIVRVTVRQLTGRARLLGFGLLSLVPAALLAAASRSAVPSALDLELGVLLVVPLFALVIPVTTLILATSALGEERGDKTLSFLVLDEPLNGADPVQRVALIDLFQHLGAAGRTVIVSSHVLHEVERLADRVIVIVHGRLAAAGSHRAIREAMGDRPRRVLLRSDDDRRLARTLLELGPVVAVELGTSGLTVSTSSAAELAMALPALARDRGVRLREVRALDASLESVFRHLLSIRR